MDHVLDTPPRQDTPRAREAGDIVLLVALYGVTVAVVLAGASLADRPPAVSVPAGRRLPFAASWSSAGKRSWQGGSISPKGLTLMAEGANGAVATIAGGETWRDYILRARVHWVSGRAMSFHVRESGPADFVACVLDGSTARIDQVAGGATRTLSSAAVPPYRGRSFDAVVVVSGERVSFSADGASVVSARLRGGTRGTAGLAVWDPERGRAMLEAEYVRVEPVAALAGTPVTRRVTPSAEGSRGGE